MAWIKVEIGLDSRREVVLIASALETDRRTTVGHLVAFWSWADGETTDGRLVGMTPTLIDEIIQVQGFADALLDDQVGWLLRYEGGLELPKYDKHHSQAAKTRALDSSRKSVSRRDPVRIDNGQDTDQRRGDKRREERKTKTPQPPKGGLWFGLEIPSELNTEPTRKAMVDWETYRRGLGRGKWSELSAKKCLTKMIGWGSARTIAAIDLSIANGWQGMYEDSKVVAASQPAPKLSDRAKGYTK